MGSIRGSEVNSDGQVDSAATRNVLKKRMLRRSCLDLEVAYVKLALISDAHLVGVLPRSQLGQG